MKTPDGAARRSAALYSRWHKQTAIVYRKEDGSFDWTARFSIDSSAQPIKVPGKLVARYVDGKPV